MPRPRAVDRICSVTDCATPIRAKGLCPKHYARLMAHGATDLVSTPRYESTCIIDGCDNRQAIRGCCMKHAARIRVHGSPFLDPTSDNRYRPHSSHRPGMPEIDPDLIKALTIAAVIDVANERVLDGLIIKLGQALAVNALQPISDDRLSSLLKESLLLAIQLSRD